MYFYNIWNTGECQRTNRVRLKSFTGESPWKTKKENELRLKASTIADKALHGQLKEIDRINKGAVKRYLKGKK